MLGSKWSLDYCFLGLLSINAWIIFTGFREKIKDIKEKRLNKMLQLKIDIYL